MLKQLEVAGFGQALAGLDWLALDGVESQRTEIRQLASSANAAWQFLWSDPDEHEKLIALVAKKDSAKRPFAAAALLRTAIPDKTFMSLITVEAGLYWIFAQVNGLPAKRMDFVGTEHEVMAMARDFVTTRDRSHDLPVYTDEAELFLNIPYRMELRSMSLEVLGHSLKKNDFKNAKFERYSAVSLQLMVTAFVFALIGIGYTSYQSHIKNQQARSEALARQTAKEKNIAQILLDIDKAINSTLPVKHLSQYLQSLHRLPASIAGWQLSKLQCNGHQCDAVYTAQPLTTWRGYMAAKPQDWPTPVLDSGFEQIIQPVHIAKESVSHRQVKELAQHSDLRFDIGNLAQISRLIGLQLQPINNWKTVVAAKGPGAEAISVPIQTSFDVTGPAILLESFATRLPISTGVEQITFSVKDDISFSMKVQAYAQP